MEKGRNIPQRRMPALAAAAALVTGGAVVAAAPPAYSAPPGNDTIANARVIPDIPTRIVQNTRRASSSANDGQCVGGDSVWYRFRPISTEAVRVVTIGSDFDTVLAVFRGGRASRTLVACNDDAAGLASAVRVRFVAGARYWIAVSACCGRSEGGGRSVLTLYRPRPAATRVHIDSVETGAVSGRLFASGTLRCATPSASAVAVVVSQRVGTMVARGRGRVEAPLCGPRGLSWEVQVDSSTGVAFQEGLASVTLSVSSSDGFQSTTTEETANLTVGTSPNRRSTMQRHGGRP